MTVSWSCTTRTREVEPRIFFGTVLRSSYTSKHPVGSEGALSPVIKMETKENRVWGLDPSRFCVDGSKCHTLLKDVYEKLSKSKKWAQLSSNSIHNVIIPVFTAQGRSLLRVRTLRTHRRRRRSTTHLRLRTQTQGPEAGPTQTYTPAPRFQRCQ